VGEWKHPPHLLFIHMVVRSSPRRHPLRKCWISAPYYLSLKYQTTSGQNFWGHSKRSMVRAGSCRMVVCYLSSGWTMFRKSGNSPWSRTKANERVAVNFFNQWNSGKKFINWNNFFHFSHSHFFSFFHLPSLISFCFILVFLFLFYLCF
jgi:hypothetical protein